MTEQAPAPPDGVNPVPVEHRVLGLDRRLMAPVLAVGFIALLWSVIVPFIASPAGFDNTVEPGVALQVNNGVSFTPTPGWELDETGFDEPVEIRHSGLVFLVRTGTFDGDLQDLIQSAYDLGDIDGVVAKSQSSITTSQGVTGIMEPFDGPNRHGQVTVFARDGIGVQVVVDGPIPTADNFDPQIDEMIDSILFSSEAPA